MTDKEYHDKLARRKGYKDHSDYQKECRHKAGTCQDMSENKDCSQYLGVHVAERILSKVFENVQRMSNNNIGYDFICRNGFKIDVKSSCLRSNNYWNFHIRQNKIADYFLLLSFDNRVDLNPKYIWLIRGIDTIVNNSGSTALNEKTGLLIPNTTYSLSKYEKYEQTDKLEKVIGCCDTLKTDI